VYGVAVYVSKQDVLADPLFESFALLSKESSVTDQTFTLIFATCPLPWIIKVVFLTGR
jgi:hypothetical protein